MVFKVLFLYNKLYKNENYRNSKKSKKSEIKILKISENKRYETNIKIYPLHQIK